MLDEAVAIVMAPKDPSHKMGVFRLTPPGMDLVGSCTERSFHNHPRTSTGAPIEHKCEPLYLDERAEFQVVDLR